MKTPLKSKSAGKGKSKSAGKSKLVIKSKSVIKKSAGIWDNVHSLLYKHKFLLLALVLGGCLLFTVMVLSSAEGPRSGGTFADDSARGTLSWSTTGNANASDNAYATASLDDNVISHYLKVTNFGFSIPAGSNIDGITVEVEKKAGTASRIQDDHVRIVKGGTIGGAGSDKATTSWWGTSDSYVSYGGASDLWGLGWNNSDINSSGFGVAISATKASTAGGAVLASIDHVRITVTYSIPVTVTNVSSTALDGSYNAGDIIPVTVSFSESVTVTGTPRLTLETGGTDALVNYSSGSPGTTLTFNYTVVSGHTSSDLDYISTGALALNGGTIKDTSTGLRNAVLTLASPGASGSLGANKNLVIDTTKPGVTVTSTAPAVTNVSPVPFKATFTEAVTGFVDTDITVGNGSVTSFTPDLVTAPVGSVYDFAVTPTGQGAVTVDIAGAKCQDGAGNDNNASVQISKTYDSINPTLGLSTTAPDPTNTSPIPFTATFNENVTGFAAGDVSVTNGSAGNLAGGPSIYTFDVTPAGQGTVTVDVNAGVAQDTAGNNNAAATASVSRVFDSVKPTVSLTSTVGSSTNVSPIPMTATFSKDVTGFISTDVTVVNGTVSGFTGGPAVYTFDVTPAGDGTVTVDINADVAEDSATNTNFAAVSYSTVYDTTPPSVIAVVAKDTNEDGIMDRLELTFDEALVDTASGSNGFDVTSVENHGLCNSEVADPDGTTSLIVDFVCSKIDTAVDDLTLDFVSNPEIADSLGHQTVSASFNSGSVPPITDGAQPVVTSTVPSNSSVGALFSGDSVVNFSEPVNTGTFVISDDDTNTFAGAVWSNGNKKATIAHTAWTFFTLVTVTVDVNDLNGLSLNGVGTYSFSFTTGDNSNLGEITVPAGLTVTNSGTDLSNGVNTGSGGNIIINTVTQSLSSVTDGDLAGADLTVAQNVGDQSVLPLTAVTLNSTGPINLTNSGLSGVSVDIPNNTTLYGCAGWDGLLNLKAGSNSGNAPSGFSVGGTVYEVGSVSCPLLLSQPATILMAGLTGDVAYKPTGSSNWYTVPVCGGTYAVPTPPVAPTPFMECSISNGVDTKILTYHFTSFGTLSASSGSSDGSGGGRGAWYYQNVQRQSNKDAEEANLHGSPGEGDESSTDESSTGGSGVCNRMSKLMPDYSDLASSPALRFYAGELYAKCAIDAISDKLFGVDEAVSRAVLSKVVSVMFNLGTADYYNLYSDVVEGDSYTPYLLKSALLGLIRGRSENVGGLFVLEPEKPLSRAEAMFMIIKATGVDLNNYDKKAGFVDVKEGDWFYKVASYAQNEKLIFFNDVSFGKEGPVSKWYRFRRLLGVTDTGKDVANLKSIMKQLDYYTGNLDDVYDLELAEALKIYQRANGIFASGNMGIYTRAKLLREYLHKKSLNYFRPYDAITRGEMAEVVYKVGRGV